VIHVGLERRDALGDELDGIFEALNRCLEEFETLHGSWIRRADPGVMDASANGLRRTLTTSSGH
jgi:hypothetical protein